VADRPAGNSWAQLHPSGGPPPARDAHNTVAWDAINSQLLLFGGVGGSTLFRDLWAYQPASNRWAQLRRTGGPRPARDGYTAVWDTANAQLLVFGGFGRSLLDELWAYRPARDRWLRLRPSGESPPARHSHTAVWDAASAQMLVFGGKGDDGDLDDLWAYRPASNCWLPLSPSDPPRGRHYHSAVWDAGSGQMLVFGGWSGNDLDDLWTYRLASNCWVQLRPSGGLPLARHSHTAVWDAANAQMLLFGGVNGRASYLDDVWAYRPASNSWAQLSPAGGPPLARSHHTAVWDAANAQLLVFGGYGGSRYLDDLWAYRPPRASRVPHC
jgi:N-acetylneuraminic acid mutarotase